MSQKKVSVIIPTYKRPVFLQRAINSVLFQTYKNIEILVIDDNNDGDQYRLETEYIMQSFEDNDKVLYYKHAKNLNGSAARNTGLQNATGEYIAFLDDDDYFLPGRIERSVEFLDNSSDSIGGCCVNYIKKYKNLIYKQSSYNCISDDCSRLLDGTIDYGAGSTLMIKRSILNEIHGYDASYKRHQDWEFLIRIFRNYSIVNIPYLGIVISADGIRNNPNTQLLVAMKTKLFSEFQNDIEILPNNVKHRICVNQKKEIFHSYLLGRQYKIAFSYYKQIERLGLAAKLKDIPHIVLSSIVGVCPSFMLFVYWIYNCRYVTHKNYIRNLEKKYSGNIK